MTPHHQWKVPRDNQSHDTIWFLDCHTQYPRGVGTGGALRVPRGIGVILECLGRHVRVDELGNGSASAQCLESSEFIVGLEEELG